jgi:hypothetical protein
MVGAMIGRLETSSFEVIGIIKRGNFSNFYVVGYLSIGILLLSFGVLYQVCHAHVNHKCKSSFPTYTLGCNRANNFASIRHMQISQK